MEIPSFDFVFFLVCEVSGSSAGFGESRYLFRWRYLFLEPSTSFQSSFFPRKWRLDRRFFSFFPIPVWVLTPPPL